MANEQTTSTDAEKEIERLKDELATERAKRTELETDLEQLAEVVRANADGDLATTPDAPESDRADALYEAYRDLLTEWQGTVDRMSSFSEQVSSATERVDDRIGAVKGASREVSGAVEEISSGSHTQSSRIGDISDEMRSLSATIEEIAASANEVATTSEEASERGTSAQKAAGNAMEELEQLTDHAETTADKVEQLNDLMTEIEDIVEFITDVADQTNILALNANIEAARAGKEGEGFTVVANEVKNLASETKRATDEIESSIERVHEHAESTVSEMHETQTTVESTHSAVERALARGATLTERADSLERTLDRFELSDSGGAVDEDTTVVEFWHAMGGEKALLLESLAREFEAEADGISLALSSKGSYSGTLNATLDAAGLGNGPAIAQVFEIGSTRARDSGHFMPVDELLPANHVDSLLDPLSNYYRMDGSLQSLPFNASNPILAYNQDVFREAGLDPNNPPGTFDDVASAAEAIVSSGAADYGITFANYSWFVEQWFAEANEMLVDNENGRAGTPRSTNLDGAFANDLLEWWVGMEADELYFDPGIEARGKARNVFHDGDAAMVIGSTSSLRSIESGAEFDVGTGMFPVHSERTGVLVGGASLWVSNALQDETRAAVGEFLTWLTEPEQQKRWHRETGYFPVHESAIPELRQEGWFDENPHFATAFDQLVETRDTLATRGAQMGPFDTVRTIIEECYDSIDDPSEVSSALDRLDSKVEKQLQSYAAEQ